MKKTIYIPFLILFGLSSCNTQKPVNKIIISNLELKKIEINSYDLIDSILITNIKLPNNISPDTFNKQHTELTYSKLVINDPIVLSKAIKDSIISFPNVKNIYIKSVSINKIKYQNDSLEIHNIILDTLILNKKIEKIDFSEIGIKDLNSKRMETQRRIDSLKIVLQKKSKTNPDNSISVLLKSEYFKKIDEKINEIYEYCLNKKNHDPNITSAKFEDLIKINIKLDYIEKAILDPQNEPRLFLNKLFFSPGEFIIESTKNNTTLGSYINEIIKNIDLVNINDKVTIILSISGYSDELDVMSNLKERLLSLIKDKNYSKYENETEQEYLNRILSEQRVHHVFDYIKNKIINHYKDKNIKFDFDQSQCKGMGLKLPIEYKGGCKNKDCEERRVVYISKIVLL